MQSQQPNSWMVYLGAHRVTTQETIDTDAHNIKTRIIQQLKADIAEKIDAGISDRASIYKALLDEDKIPVFDGNVMTIKAFGVHLCSVSVTKTKNCVPTGEKAKKIFDLFESGVSEDDIVKKHGFDDTYVYVTLVKYGRIKKRSHANSKRHDSILLLKMDALLKSNLSVAEISKKTGASKKYITNLRCVRNKAVQLLKKGKTSDEVRISLKRISLNYARHLEKEVKSL
jgi:hypothetical protein